MSPGCSYCSTGYGTLACNVITSWNISPQSDLLHTELRDDVLDNTRISKWKRLTATLNVITRRVDLIFWGVLVLLSYWSMKSSHLSVWCHICLKLSQLWEWEPLKLMYLIVTGKTWPAHHARRQASCFVVAFPIFSFFPKRKFIPFSDVLSSLFNTVDFPTETDSVAIWWP